MENYLKQHSIVYRQAPEFPEDGAAVGNRDLTAVIYYDSGNYSVIFAKDDIWDNRPMPDEKFIKGLTHKKLLEKIEKDKNTDSFTGSVPGTKRPFSRELKYPYDGEPVHSWTPYPVPKVAAWLSMDTNRFKFQEQRLSLFDATVCTLYKGLKISSVIPSGCGCNLFIAEIESDQENILNTKIMRHKDPCMETAPKFYLSEGIPVFTYNFPDGFYYSMAVKAESADAEYYVKESEINIKLKVNNKSRLLVSVSSSNDAKDTAKEAIKAFEKAGDYIAKNKKYWSGFWEKSRVMMSDKYLENMWYFTLYQAAVSFSPRYSGGFYGSYFFYESVAWNNDLHDVNEPFKFYGVQAANHPELAEGFINTYFNMIPTVRKNTMKYYGFDGLRYPHACGYSGDERETWDDALIFQYMQSASGLIAHIAWDQYLFTKDMEELKNRIYPIICGAADFYSNYMEKGNDGYYHIYPSFSPEQLPSLFCRDALIDLAMAKYTLKAAIASSELLNIDAKKRENWKERLGNMAPYPRNNKGLVEYEGDQCDYVFAHDSIAYCIHPAAEYEQTQQYYDLLEMVLNRLGIDDTATFAKLHLVTTALWLGMGDKAYDLLYDLCICPYFKPNGFGSIGDVYEGQCNVTNLKYYPEKWKQKTGIVRDKRDIFAIVNPRARDTIEIDTTQGLLMVLNEMLLQSQKDIIRVFPGLASHQDAAFDNLLARGSVKVSSVKKDGLIPFIRLQATTDTRITLEIPWKDLGFTINGEEAENPGQLTLDLKKDETVLIEKENCKYEPVNWEFSKEAEPRCVHRIIKEGLVKGLRNDPLVKNRIKNAETADIWLGKPEA